jgi:hypothetical protein
MSISQRSPQRRHPARQPSSRPSPSTGRTNAAAWRCSANKGRPRLDAQNTDPSLRARPLGLTPAAGGGWAGRIYSPEDGQTYRATVRQTAADTLAIEGCVLFICHKQVWRSASALTAALR